MKREIVTVRFDLSIAERAGEEQPAPEPTQTLEVDLAALDQQDRGLLSRRMERASDNIFDVCRLQWDGTKEFRWPTLQEGRADFYAVRFPMRIQATEPTLQALLEAVRQDYKRYKIR
ncbi:MAG: hypothetical protein ACREP9_05810 [Candidatus Dormibacteraceae bacterium]